MCLIDDHSSASRKSRVRRVKVRVSAGKVKAVVPTSQSKHETIRPMEKGLTEETKVREGRVKVRVRTVKVRVRRVKVRVSAGIVKAVVPTSQSKHETIRPIE